MLSTNSTTPTARATRAENRNKHSNYLRAFSTPAANRISPKSIEALGAHIETSSTSTPGFGLHPSGAGSFPTYETREDRSKEHCARSVLQYQGETSFPESFSTLQSDFFTAQHKALKTELTALLQHQNTAHMTQNAAHEARIVTLEARSLSLEKENLLLRDQLLAIGFSTQNPVAESFTTAPTTPTSTIAPPASYASIAHTTRNTTQETLPHTWTKVVKKNRKSKPSLAPFPPRISSMKQSAQKILPSNRFAEAINMARLGGIGSDSLLDANDPFILDPAKAAPANKSKTATRSMEYYEIPAKIPINEIKKAMKTFDISTKDYETVRFIRSPTNSKVTLEFFASSWIKERLTLFCEKIMRAKKLNNFDPLLKDNLANMHKAVQFAFHTSQVRAIDRILDRHMTRKCRSILHKAMQEHEIEIISINQLPHSEEIASSAQTTGHNSANIL
jgi:hypothetical protein